LRVRDGGDASSVARDHDRRNFAGASDYIDFESQPGHNEAMSYVTVEKAELGFMKANITEDYRARFLSISSVYDGGSQMVSLELVDDGPKAEGAVRKPTLHASVLVPQDLPVEGYFVYRRELARRICSGESLLNVRL